jgi:hypothetical protein
LTRLPVGRVLYKSLIEEHSDGLETGENVVIYGRRVLYVKRVVVDLFGNSGFAYVVCDVKWRADEVTRFMVAAREDGLGVDEIDRALVFKGKFVFVSSFEIDRAKVVALYYTR